MPSDRKTEPPTPRRLRRARRDGDHPVSRAVIAFGVLAVTLVFAPLVLQALYAYSHDALLEALRPGSVPPAASSIALRVAALTSPLLGAAALGALVTGIWQTGGVLSARPLRVDLSRLRPFAALGSGFAPRLVSLSLASVAALGIGLAAWSILRAAAPVLGESVGHPAATIQLAVESCRRLGGWALGISLALAAADGVYRQVEWRARHRMTLEEVRQEQRENQGDPELRHARQRAHRELANQGATRDLARASLLVLGGPSPAVALSYDPEHDHAPRVILHGAGPLAAALEALAPSLGVPIEHDAVLARALAAVPVEQEVPRALYADIARALQRAGRFRA
ncbi:MAG TPA: EscU/YscU/HrcU family type III secretion system export apparatus switch protein [Polyangiaceae bacterium]|nr:EscU/YscU/HrcU family type III secretion system export apparatus switch protein [Polyangiaceae bacterium]